MRATEIEKDILYERFDPTLEKYKPQSALSTVTPVTPISTPKPTLTQLWEKFVEWKRPQCAPSTMKNQYRAFTSYLKRMPSQDLDNAIEIRDEALQSIPINSAKRFITALNACCDWSIQSGLITENPFHGMAAQIKLPKAEKMEDDINPFSAAERDLIIEAFSKNRYYSYYTSLVEFLFATGARPSEVLALQWKHIK